ncbi:hypothetical protein [Salidesulfovibrio onnuriiensis]|uniref:hypothetical protein n=1 Tax=Salidesulfovibrio onnuriiensis TaxID=2583823 RepID=UPI0011CAFAF0|nr:hypothetical protein [Salidesulfovibrio onnuriiensis]
MQALPLGLVQDIFGIKDLIFAKYLLAGLLVMLAILLFLLALRVLRSGDKEMLVQEKNIPQALSRAGMAIELCGKDNTPAVRCVITRAGRSKIKCDIVERMDVIRAKEGESVTLVFAPLRTAEKRVNAFKAELLESDVSGRKTDQITLSAPTGYDFLKRRKHGRKRVVDQQFIRVKIWMADPGKSSIQFQDASPDIGVNSYAQDQSGHDANSVINISKGGIALQVRNQVLPPVCAVGSPVVINIFMFNFKEKIFRPYWYAGEVRSMEEYGDGYTRLGLSFTGSGHMDEDSGTIHWRQ